MGKNISLLRKIWQTINFIPNDYNLEMSKEIININYRRVTYLSIALLILDLISILMDLTLFYPRWSINNEYVNLFHAHIVLLLERISYLLFLFFVYVKRYNYLYKLKRILIFYSCIAILIWCSYLSIYVQAINGQIYAYIICCFFIASVILLIPKESLAILLTSSLIFLCGLIAQSAHMQPLASKIINVLFIFILTWIISCMNMSMFVKNYINKITIKNQAIELENSRNKLDETVRKRTKELVAANEKLVEEMGIRHEFELQSIKTRLMYEENARLLSQIREYEEVRNVFFANLSHELRTPLNVIFSAQQMMDLVVGKQECNDCKGKIMRYNKIIKQNCYRLIRLIGNLIDITKIDAKYLEINMRNCDIARLIRNITLSVAEYIKDKDLKLCFHTDLENKIIACDPDKVERIILNLLSNAVKFTPKNGVICVSISTSKGYVVISIKDSGIGIDKDMQKIIFERFIQADKSLTRDREGSGIGLSLVKSLVDMHKGKITLHSELGKGSDFIVELPDISIDSDEYIASTIDSVDSNIERINIEFSDIYS